MHPTRTTTKLLLGVACAVSAVSGCVTVNPAPAQPGAAPAAGVPPHHGPRSGPGTVPVVVRAPALEALEAAPGRAGQPAAPAASASAGRTARHDGQGAPQGSSGAPVQAPPPVPDIQDPHRPAAPVPGRRGEARPRHERHDGEEGRELVRELPVRPADVCALGRRHGRWRPDSPEARICAGVHGD
ncbi:hypothetical protein AMK16_23060 [Streptomyces sp. CB00455]|uniref:hypothetical protein n=1 Tax=Streptomyces sp. CB00455 TaxID=1703927 RepID=UPI0009636401|nr:hypothetical protein [Streptomyces sp. CB00455]OKK17784.1 hypothetical protein AMK16_23060 [Streptomyces sp. CB00455]